MLWQGVLLDVSESKRAEEALRGSEERFRIAFEADAVGMAHASPDGRWVRVNRRLCEVVGYSREELLGLTFQDITHHEDLDKDLEHVRRMLVGEIDEYSMEKRYLKKDRSRVWISLTVSMVRAPSGEPDYFVSVVEGAAGSGFEGATLDLNNRPFAIPFYHDGLTPREPTAAKPEPNAKSLGTIGTPVGYGEYFWGTSMASPHAAGVAALAAGEYPGLLNRPGALKKLVMETGEKAPLTRGQTATGDMVNARQAVTNTAPSISNVSPSGTTSDDKPAIRATVRDLQGALSGDGATKLSGKNAVRLFVDGNSRFNFTYDGRSGPSSSRTDPRGKAATPSG